MADIYTYTDSQTGRTFKKEIPEGQSAADVEAEVIAWQKTLMQPKSQPALTGKARLLEMGIPEQSIIKTGPSEEYTAGQGYIYLTKSGTKAYVDPVYSTTDQEEIEQINQGTAPGDLFKLKTSEYIVEQNPYTTGAQSFTRGVPFAGEYVDELAGLVGGEEKQAQFRAGRQAFEDVKPKTAITGQILTGLLPTVGALGTVPSLAKTGLGTAFEKGLAAGGIGLVEGAVSGYGRGESPEERVSLAKEGGVLGLGIGGTVGSATGLFLKKPIVDFLSKTDLRKVAKELKIDKETAKLLKESLLSSNSIDDARDRMLSFGIDARLIDSSESAAELLDFTKIKLGRSFQTTQEGVNELSSERGKRFKAQMTEIFGEFEDVDDLNDIAKQVSEKTRIPRKNAYQSVYSEPINYGSQEGKRIQNILNRMNKGGINLKNAIDEANLQIAADADEIGNISPIAYKITKKENGEEIFEVVDDQTIVHLDYLKRGLQAEAAKKTDEFGNLLPAGIALNKLANQLKSSIENAVPKYKVAVGLGLDAIQEAKSLKIIDDWGKKENGVGAIRRLLESASSTDQTNILKQNMKQMLGFKFNEVSGRLRATIADPFADENSIRSALQVVKQFSNPEGLRKARLFLTDSEFSKYREEVLKLSTTVQSLSKVAMNSRTAIRTAAKEKIEKVDTKGFINQLAKGEVVNAGREFVKLFFGEMGESVVSNSDIILQNLSDILIKRKGPKAMQALESINRLMKNELITDARARQLGELAYLLPTSLVLTGAESFNEVQE